MGARGINSIQQRQAAFAKYKFRKLPWKNKKLSRVEKVIAFLEWLPITKGKLAGEQLRLLPNQLEFIRDVYGRKNSDPCRLGILSEPRGNGKTGLVAGLALCHLLGPESEPRGEIYSAAIDRQQAGIIFEEMEAIIEATPEFLLRVNTQHFPLKRIRVMDGDGDGSKYEALSADGRRAHGLSPTFWAYDELAQAKDRMLLDNLQTALGKRNRSMGMVISTQAADDDHPLSQLIDDALTGADRSTVCHILTAPATADPFDPATIRAVNPAFGHFLDEADVLNEAQRARRMPSFESAFRNLRLNQRIALHSRDILFQPEIWALGNPPVNIDLFTDGRPVWRH